MDKERLRHYRSLKLEERQLKEQENSMEAQGSEALQEFYRKNLAKLTDELLAIETAIEALPSPARVLLRDYYINCLTWEEVGEKNHYCAAQCHRIHSQALIKLRQPKGRERL